MERIRLKNLLEAKNLSLTEVQKATKIAKKTLENIYEEKSESIRFETQAKLREYLNVTFDELYGLKEVLPPQLLPPNYTCIYDGTKENANAIKNACAIEKTGLKVKFTMDSKEYEVDIVTIKNESSDEKYVIHPGDKFTIEFSDNKGELIYNIHITKPEEITPPEPEIPEVPANINIVFDGTVKSVKEIRNALASNKVTEHIVVTAAEQIMMSNDDLIKEIILTDNETKYTLVIGKRLEVLFELDETKTKVIYSITIHHEYDPPKAEEPIELDRVQYLGDDLPIEQLYAKYGLFDIGTYSHDGQSLIASLYNCQVIAKLYDYLILSQLAGTFSFSTEPGQAPEKPEPSLPKDIEILFDGKNAGDIKVAFNIPELQYARLEYTSDDTGYVKEIVIHDTRRQEDYLVKPGDTVHVNFFEANPGEIDFKIWLDEASTPTPPEYEPKEVRFLNSRDVEKFLNDYNLFSIYNYVVDEKGIMTITGKGETFTVRQGEIIVLDMINGSPTLYVKPLLPPPLADGRPNIFSRECMFTHWIGCEYTFDQVQQKEIIDQSRPWIWVRGNAPIFELYKFNQETQSYDAIWDEVGSPGGTRDLLIYLDAFKNENAINAEEWLKYVDPKLIDIYYVGSEMINRGLTTQEIVNKTIEERKVNYPNDFPENER